MGILERASRAFLTRVKRAILAGRVRVSAYARQRALDELGWEERDIIEQVADLQPEDFLRRERSSVYPEDLIWVFCPWDEHHDKLWIRLLEREGVLIISFHRA